MAETKILIRRGSASEWAEADPVLRGGELGYETDTNSIKVGNGTDSWTELPYFGGGIEEPPPSNLAAHVNSATPHPVYDDGPSFLSIYRNAKV